MSGYQDGRGELEDWRKITSNSRPGVASSKRTKLAVDDSRVATREHQDGDGQMEQ
jgi:hypothetical protein